MKAPSVSIVVPVLDAAGALAGALESLAQQDFPALEVIVQDGGSRDGSAELAQAAARRRPEIFKVFVEKDDGYGNALDRGFARARGGILCRMGAGDRLLPGAVRSVVEQIPPAGPHAVLLGRSLYHLEGSPIGVPHPSEYLGRFEHLAIWKRGLDTVPRPSLFFTSGALERAGPFAVGPPFVVDFDFICRLGRQGSITRSEQTWGATLMPGMQLPAGMGDAERLRCLIDASRLHWGPWTSPLRWRSEASLAIHRRHLHERARHHARRSEQAALEGRAHAAFIEAMQVWLASPTMAKGRFNGRLAPRVSGAAPG